MDSKQKKSRKRKSIRMPASKNQGAEKRWLVENSVEPQRQISSPLPKKKKIKDKRKTQTVQGEPSKIITEKSRKRKSIRMPESNKHGAEKRWLVENPVESESTISTEEEAPNSSYAFDDILFGISPGNPLLQILPGEGSIEWFEMGEENFTETVNKPYEIKRRKSSRPQKRIYDPEKDYYYSAAATYRYHNLHKDDCVKCLCCGQSGLDSAGRRRSTRKRKTPERLKYTVFHAKKEANTATIKRKEEKSCVAAQIPPNFNVEDVIKDILPDVPNEERKVEKSLDKPLFGRRPRKKAKKGNAAVSITLVSPKSVIGQIQLLDGERNYVTALKDIAFQSIDGRVVCHLINKSLHMKKGDTIHIPKGQQYKLENTCQKKRKRNVLFVRYE
ncbi:uncharacterized protein LOC130626128 isoform X2 [Hydractinia symbiolongicarpus]|uniref:uncharacterized protein LOC130626128 isoform X2 n=1 Tax=Hydractinia symbiolongicarpus TaxID=13093 RepID=UPI0025515445|nr:uncharacterized protein LOC130626128 isoform X2 [Hydractinia symbiolongicarpus]